MRESELNESNRSGKAINESTEKSNSQNDLIVPKSVINQLEDQRIERDNLEKSYRYAVQEIQKLQGIIVRYPQKLVSIR